VPARTIATAIKIGDPASWNRAVRAVRFTRGVVLSVSDEEILEAKRVVDRAGVGCEPASAASLAGVRRHAARGGLGPEDRVVAILTGHMLKDPEILTGGPAGAPARLSTIEPTLRALEEAMESTSNRDILRP
jgi:threonine synthase